MRPIVPALAGVLMLYGCGGTPSPSPEAAATPSPTATAAPTATPNPFAAACGIPLPSIDDLYGFGIKVQLEPSVRRKILNSNPYVRNASYCGHPNVVPYPNGQFCETRQELNPQRVPCDNYIAGIAVEGGSGPDWFQEINGQRLRCPGPNTPGDAPDCRLKDNQYLLDVFAPGKYVACGGKGSNGTCGVCVLAPETYDTPQSVIDSGTRRPGLCQV